MSGEILNPQARTYWIATDGGGYICGETLPLQQTTFGNGWMLYWAGTDPAAYAAQCDTVGISPVLTASSVSARQIRLWLVSHGIGLAAVESAIDALPDAVQREAVRVEWEYAPYVERNHSMLVPLAESLGLSEGQVDMAFVEAARL